MQQQRPADESAFRSAESGAYPHGRGYGHDYMRGGEVFGGYGYSEREEYERRRGETSGREHAASSGDGARTGDGAS